jgi:hypothetical protein
MSGIYGLLNDINTADEIKLPHRLFIGLIFVGLFVKILSSLINSNVSKAPSAVGEATGTIWGYGMILFSLLGLVILKLDNTLSPNKQFINVPPTLYVLAAIILWIIIMNALNYKQINRKTIPPTYYTWSKWSTAFIFIITILIMLQFSVDAIKNKGVYAKLFTENLYTINVYAGFVLFLNLLITAIQWIIIQNFTVDG